MFPSPSFSSILHDIPTYICLVSIAKLKIATYVVTTFK